MEHCRSGLAMSDFVLDTYRTDGEKKRRSRFHRRAQSAQCCAATPAAMYAAGNGSRQVNHPKRLETIRNAPNPRRARMVLCLMNW